MSLSMAPASATDGQIWGGEFLVLRLRGFRRYAHLRYVPFPAATVRQAKAGEWRLLIFTTRSDRNTEIIDLPCWNAAPETSWKLIRSKLIARGGA